MPAIKYLILPTLLVATACGCAPPPGGTTFGPGVEHSGASGSSRVSAAAATPAASRRAASGQRQITFEVTGKGVGKATSISYGVGGNTSQANGARLPWKKRSASGDRFLLLSLVAQSADGSAGSISCKIIVDGKVIVENSSQGQYAVVTCSGTA